MPTDVMMRSFYTDVLYTRAGAQLPPLLELNNPWHKERKFSFVFVNECFMKAVKQMEEAVLVPNRLKDMEAKGGETPVLVARHDNLLDVFKLLRAYRDRMQALGLATEEEAGLALEEVTVESAHALTLSAAKAMDCDSGLWSLSSASSSTSRESIEEDGAASDDRSSTDGTDSDACSLSLDSTLVVKKSLHSAKALCSFLSELTAVAHFVLHQYLREMQCDLCE